MLETAFPDADDSPGLLLWRVTNAWQAAQRSALKPFGLTHVQFVLLASLAHLHSEAEITQSDLASHAGTDPMMTSQVLRALEERDLVSRRPHPTDARARSLSATPDGIALVNRAVHAVEGVDARFFEVLRDDVPAFASLLAALDRSSRP